MNAQSVVSKINELSCTVCDMEPDLILITESWCNSDVMNAFLGIAGYELQPELRLDRLNTVPKEAEVEGYLFILKWDCRF